MKKEARYIAAIVFITSIFVYRGMQGSVSTYMLMCMRYAIFINCERSVLSLYSPVRAVCIDRYSSTQRSFDAWWPAASSHRVSYYRLSMCIRCFQLVQCMSLHVCTFLQPEGQALHFCVEWEWGVTYVVKGDRYVLCAWQRDIYNVCIL